MRSISHDSDVYGTYRENIDFGYRLLISFLRVIRPEEYELKYPFGPKMLEYDQKKLYISLFLQLVFVMNSPLRKIKDFYPRNSYFSKYKSYLI
jgi:hypothetical protein